MTFAWQHSKVIEYFDTFEARETAFNQAVGRLLPVRYKGAEAFWRDFGRIARGDTPAGEDLPAFITSNPRDCLAFGSPLQVLSAVHATARGKSGRAPDTHLIARQFGLGTVLTQPIRTLSGGETVRLALAKAMIAASFCDQLVIASPFCWMAARHMPLLDRVVGAFDEESKPVRILCMRDEADPSPVSRSRIDRLALPPLGFTLTCRGCRIALGTPINSVTARPAFARVQDAALKLASPCLMVGDNGQGKSLLAKALSGAMVTEGTAAIECNGRPGRPRLLFQDVITQALMRPPEDILRGHSENGRPEADGLYREILTTYHSLCPVSAQTADDCMPQLKTALIAARLQERPAALILDEPDWGLSRDAAIALVLSVIRKAHAWGVPVILISHKPWWPSLAASSVTVRRIDHTDGPQRFSIDLSQPETRP